MGWLYQNEPLRHEKPVDYFRRELTFSRDGMSSTVLDAAAVRGTVYAAVRNTNYPVPGADYVYCAVILFKNNERDGFGYKDMCESMGPCEVDCPDRIMKLLTPVEQIPNPSYTADWRERVAAAKERRKTTAKLKPGDVIKLRHDATFGKTGVVASEFHVLHFRKRTPIFEPIGFPGFLCRLGPSTLAMATLVTEPPVKAVELVE